MASVRRADVRQGGEGRGAEPRGCNPATAQPCWRSSRGLSSSITRQHCLCQVTYKLLCQLKIQVQQINSEWSVVGEPTAKLQLHHSVKVGHSVQPNEDESVDSWQGEAEGALWWGGVLWRTCIPYPVITHPYPHL